MRVQVIINKAHNLLPDQVRVLYGAFRQGWERYDVPESGWTLSQIREDVLPELEDCITVFASPVPALILLLACSRAGYGVYVLHNDRRVAREVPDGKGGVRVIHSVAPDGWELV
jgi:hypothetical protein